MVAGSSWPQDEAIFIPYFHEHPEMKLIIAPHEICLLYTSLRLPPVLGGGDSQYFLEDT